MITKLRGRNWSAQHCSQMGHGRPCVLCSQLPVRVAAIECHWEKTLLLCAQETIAAQQTTNNVQKNQGTSQRKNMNHESVVRIVRRSASSCFISIFRSQYLWCLFAQRPHAPPTCRWHRGTKLRWQTAGLGMNNDNQQRHKVGSICVWLSLSLRSTSGSPSLSNLTFLKLLSSGNLCCVILFCLFQKSLNLLSISFRCFIIFPNPCGMHLPAGLLSQICSARTHTLALTTIYWKMFASFFQTFNGD